jgi:aminoglycoside 6-adenylyltransferase
MRSDDEILNLIIHVAQTDDRIRAVLLNGSRANPNAIQDRFRDFDIVYLVNEIETFLNDPAWIDIFGERLILQMPETMFLQEPLHKDIVAFHYLMLFKDGSRIDLCLFPLEKLQADHKKDSLTIVLLDKDDRFTGLPAANDSDYLIKSPTQKEFSDCCNEFWWVSTYVAKALWRNELVYAKAMFEGPVRSMFLKMIEWKIGIDTGFSISFGNNGRNIERYLSPGLYEKLLTTYADHDPANNWKALFAITRLFSDLAHENARSLNLHYNKDEDNNVTSYLQWIYRLEK